MQKLSPVLALTAIAAGLCAAPVTAAPIPGAHAEVWVEPVTEADAAGNAAVVWERADGLQLSRTRGGRFARPRTVAAGVGPEEEGSGPELAVRRGAVLIAWTRNDHSVPGGSVGDCCERLRALLIDRRGRSIGPRLLSPAGTSVTPAAVALGADRRAVVAWNDEAHGPRVNVGSARRGLGRAERIPPLGLEARIVTAWFHAGRLRLLAQQRGRLVALRRIGRGRWAGTASVRLHGGEVVAASTAPSGAQAALIRRDSGARVVASRRASGRFRLQHVTTRAFTVALALSPSGRMVLAWTLPHGVRIATGRAGDRIGPPWRVRASAPSQSPGAAASPDGRVAVVWQDGDALRGVVARPGRPFPRPRRLAGSLAWPARGAPLFLGGTPMAVFNGAGRVWAARMRP